MSSGGVLFRLPSDKVVKQDVCPLNDERSCDQANISPAKVIALNLCHFCNIDNQGECAIDAIHLHAVAGFSLVDGMAEALAGVNEYFAKFSIGDSAIDGCHSTPADLLRKHVPLIYTQTKEGKLYRVEQTDKLT